MSSDLISRSALIKSFCGACANKNCKTEYDVRDCTTLSKVRNQPTAYNVDKVVEQLTEYEIESGHSEFMAMCDIKNIVKGGME